jgi:hypothetical protein
MDGLTQYTASMAYDPFERARIGDYCPSCGSARHADCGAALAVARIRRIARYIGDQLPPRRAMA